MNKCTLFLILSLAIASCKSDVKSESKSDEIATSESQNSELKIVNAGTETDSIDNTLASNAQNGSMDGYESEVNTEVKESTPKPKKKLKKRSFNPPHIAVLEQEYEEEYVEQEQEPIKKSKTLVSKKDEVSSNVAKQEKPIIVKSTESITTKVVQTRPEEAHKKVNTKTDLTEIVFKRNFYSFGDIIQGDTVRFNFDFTNIGEAPLIIENAKGSCSCTHPEYPLLPIGPGESGKISGIYVSDDKNGPQNASVTITTNTEPRTHQLLLDGTVSISEELSEDASDKD